MAPNKIKQKTFLLQFFLRVGWGCFLSLHGHTEKPLHVGLREGGLLGAS